jgi:hypothetical protein
MVHNPASVKFSVSHDLFRKAKCAASSHVDLVRQVITSKRRTRYWQIIFFLRLYFLQNVLKGACLPSEGDLASDDMSEQFSNRLVY